MGIVDGLYHDGLPIDDDYDPHLTGDQSIISETVRHDGYQGSLQVSKKCF